MNNIFSLYILKSASLCGIISMYIYAVVPAPQILSVLGRINLTMKLTVCIGSSCHIKGSRQVVEQLQRLISENNVADKVTLSGAFCMGKCQQGVCVTFNGNFYSVTPANVEEFFRNDVMSQV